MENITRCACGCGATPLPGKRFIRGHWSRTNAARRMYDARRRLTEPANPSGLCMCGCGQTTPLAHTNRAERGYYPGQHVRYVLGHQVPKGDKNPNWKGGRIMRYGYVQVLAPDSPSADSKGYVPEHRYVMEQSLDRRLEPHEHVHHINGIKTDNRLENLIVLTKQQHHRVHMSALREWAKANPEAAREACRQAQIASTDARKKKRR